MSTPTRTQVDAAFHQLVGSEPRLLRARCGYCGDSTRSSDLRREGWDLVSTAPGVKRWRCWWCREEILAAAGHPPLRVPVRVVRPRWTLAAVAMAILGFGAGFFLTGWLLSLWWGR